MWADSQPTVVEEAVLLVVVAAAALLANRRAVAVAAVSEASEPARPADRAAFLGQAQVHQGTKALQGQVEGRMAAAEVLHQTIGGATTDPAEAAVVRGPEVDREGLVVTRFCTPAEALETPR